jgi:hypothetical protein
MKPLAGPARRLYLSAQLVLVAGALVLAVPFWVIHLHDRYLARAAAQCFDKATRGDDAERTAFKSHVVEELSTEFPTGCQGNDCAERIWAAMYHKRLVPPSEIHGDECNMATVPSFRSRQSGQDYVQWALRDCQLNFKGRELLACEVNQMASIDDLGPRNTWSDESSDDLQFGIRSGSPLVVLVFDVHQTEAIATTILILSPLLLAGLVRWVRWVMGHREAAAEKVTKT